MGTSTPRFVSPGEKFVVRFAAYTLVNRHEVVRIFRSESPTSRARLDLNTSLWLRNTKVVVRLAAGAAKVVNPIQTFDWNGKWHILHFDVETNDDPAVMRLTLRLDVAVEGLPITTMRPDVEVRQRRDSDVATPPGLLEVNAPRTAFASYAREDRREVLGRVRSIQIFTGIDVYLDCLSVRPGDDWKGALEYQIRKRDIFWLFWSRSAHKSPWVEWEWRTALSAKTLRGIQPHPLEPVEVAPPPTELSALQFGAMYEWYLSALRESWIRRSSRNLWARVSAWWRP